VRTDKAVHEVVRGMNTDACESCGDAAPEPLLRTVPLSVDGDRVDGQTLCPECFSEWISRYQTEMATNMLQSASDAEPDVGNDITIAEETEPSPDLGTGNNALDQAVANAGNRGERDSQSNNRRESSDLASHTDGSSGTDINEVGGKPPQGPGTTEEVDVDLEDDSEKTDDEDDDSAGFF
jgi:hypothetical protein